MIFINPDLLNIPTARRAAMSALTIELAAKPANERGRFINDKRDDAWGHAEVIDALRSIAGNKCWYSEIHLEGADPNVDHFRPKGKVREVDASFTNTGSTREGYWWLAFEPLNFRFASMHSNQRRVDENTAGGKWDYFPVRGARAAEGTSWGLIAEDTLALDPCSATDVRLLWFDPDGKPCVSNWKRDASRTEIERVRATIWLYHLDKQEIQKRRTSHVQDIQKDLRKANIDYNLWSRDSSTPNLQSRQSFDQKIAEIKTKTADNAVFAGAKRCAIRAAIAEFSWIEEFNVV
jgi:hypothetical protein